MTLKEYVKNFQWGEKNKFITELSKFTEYSSSHIRKIVDGYTTPSVKLSLKIVKFPDFKGKVKLEDLRPDIW